MRKARLKPDNHKTWHHCYNHTVGPRSDLPFSDCEKEKFVEILHRVADFYAVDVVAYVFMGNHIHFVLQTPTELLDEKEVAERYERFYHGEKQIKPGTEVCAQWAERLRDVSWFMRHFQHLAAAWYNRTTPEPRTGPLWSGRFKNTVLEDGEALWRCLSYVEANPWRAKIVDDPADYRFSSYGRWSQTGHHPFAGNIANCVAPSMPYPLEKNDCQSVMQRLQIRYAKEIAKAKADAENPAATAAPINAPLPSFSLGIKRRVRHWVYGRVIGSEIFIREVTARAYPKIAHYFKELVPAETPAGEEPVPIFCWQKLGYVRE